MPDQNDDRRNGQLSAQLVEEGYVNLQERMQTYRQARNQTHLAAGLDPGTDPVIMLQDAVETFFHLIRPYVENEPRLSEYWRGALADYPDREFTSAEHALGYFEEHSVGVWQSQSHTRALSTQQAQLPTGGDAAPAMTDGGGGAPAPDAVHRVANLSESVRVLVVEEAFDDEDFNGYYFVEGRFAVVGLRDVKNWRVTTRKTRSRGSGFMASETSESEVREPEPAGKVETVAEMLVDVADELNAIATFSPSGDRVHGTPVPEK